MREGAIHYVEGVCGTAQTVDQDLPEDALAAVRSGQGIEAVAQRYREPIVALQDHDLDFPESVEFAYYAVYNFFRRYARQEEIDDWVLVNQSLSSTEDAKTGTVLLRKAIKSAARAQ